MLERRRKPRIRCPNCLSTKGLDRIQSRPPWQLLPFWWLLRVMRCDACLMTFYRIRFLGWTFRRGR